MVRQVRSSSAIFTMISTPGRGGADRGHRLAISGAVRGPPLNRLLELRHLSYGEVPKLSGFERTQVHRADLYPFELLHQAAKVFEHHADLVFAALEQPHLVPRVLGAVREL